MAEAPLRADARRNRERLLAVARAAFTAGDDPPLEALARDAGVGIGTLYRHFPTREALVEAAYRAELTELCARVDGLLAEHPPEVALRVWLDHYAAFVATKRSLPETMRAMITSGSLPSVRTRETVDEAVGALLAAGARAGTLRGDVPPDDVVTLLVGLFLATADPRLPDDRPPDDRATTSPSPSPPPSPSPRIARLLDLVVAGLRP